MSWNEKLCHLKLIIYEARLLGLNEYLSSLPGNNFSDKFGVNELNEILFKGMPNIWSKQAYVQGFDCEYILFKKSVNMF